MSRKTIKILDIKIDLVDKKSAIEQFAELVVKNKHALVCTPNTEFIIAAQTDDEFKNILNKTSELNIPDSTGVLWAAWFLSLNFSKSSISPVLIFLTWFSSILLMLFYPKFYRKPLAERVPGSEFIWPIARLAAAKKYKVFLLGGAHTVAERVSLNLQTEVPGLRIAGIHSGTPNESDEIVECINKSGADILMVAFGAPKQEKWLNTYLKKTCCKIGIGLGGTFDFIAGTRKRAPELICKIGLEWLYRLIQEPKRIKRQLSIPRLMWLTLLEKIESNLKSL